MGGAVAQAQAIRARSVAHFMATTNRTWLVALVIAVVGTTVGYLRIPARGRDTLYAEDGRVFIGDWLNHHSWSVLYRPYMGYQHLLPRIASGLVVGLLPIRWWATAMSLIACTLVGAGAALVYVFSRDVVASVAARVGLAAIIVVPARGPRGCRDMANLHWYLLYLMVWILLAVPRSPRAAVLITVLALVVALTEPQCVLVAPLAGFVFWHRRTSRPIVAGWALGICLQGVTYLSAPRPRNPGAPRLASAIKGYLVNASLSNGSADHATVGRLVRDLGWWVAAASLFVFLAFAAFACWRGTTIVRITVLTVLSVSAASWFGSFYENNSSLYNYSAFYHDQLIHMPLVRWGTAAAMLLAAVIPLAAATSTDRNPRLWPVAAATIALMVLLMGLSLTSPDNPRRGPRWNSAVNDAAATCRATTQTSVEIPTARRRWSVPVSCAALR